MSSPNVSTSPDQSVTDHGNSDSKSSDDTTQVKEPLEFLGILNEPIARSEIVRADKNVYNEITETAEMQDIPLEQLDESEHINVYTDFAYYALPLYPCLTDRESE